MIMKKTIFAFTILVSIFALTLNSCNKDDKNDNDIPNQEQGTEESSLRFTMDGITTTEVMGEITACADGFFQFLGSAPDGSPLALSTGKIMVNETRSICSFYLEEDDYSACIADAGISFGGTVQNNYYSPLSGTATRSSTHDITISGVLVKIDDLTEHAFTLEATAGVVTTIYCE